MFSILLAAGQDHSVVINDLKHMLGKLFNSPLATACFNFGFSERCAVAFLGILGKVLPLQTTGHGGGPLETRWLPPQEPVGELASE